MLYQLLSLHPPPNSDPLLVPAPAVVELSFRDSIVPILVLCYLVSKQFFLSTICHSLLASLAVSCREHCTAEYRGSKSNRNSLQQGKGKRMLSGGMVPLAWLNERGIFISFTWCVEETSRRRPASDVHNLC